MTIEWARATLVAKPWGRTDLRPWSSKVAPDGEAIGEIWFERDSASTARPLLLLKLLFTDAPLSIQVHPDDEAARGLGQLNGKSEAWYVLDAAKDARLGLGLRTRQDAARLRSAIEDASLPDLVDWRAVGAGDVLAVPAGAIHALGAGLVVAEVQQNSDTTFRLFDYGRGRALDVEEGVAVAGAGPVASATPAVRLDEGRMLLLQGPHFTIEKLDLSAGTARRLMAERETWLLVIGGDLHVAQRRATIGEALFLDADALGIEAGPRGLSALVAYPGPVQPHLLAYTPAAEVLEIDVPVGAGTELRA